jgi:hypothetical protein
MSILMGTCSNMLYESLDYLFSVGYVMSHETCWEWSELMKMWALYSYLDNMENCRILVI